ncbi:MAG: OmpA family protein, partial [Pseudomonadota bacterium]
IFPQFTSAAIEDAREQTLRTIVDHLIDQRAELNSALEAQEQATANSEAVAQQEIARLIGELEAQQQATMAAEAVAANTGKQLASLIDQRAELKAQLEAQEQATAAAEAVASNTGTNLQNVLDARAELRDENTALEEQLAARSRGELLMGNLEGQGLSQTDLDVLGGDPDLWRSLELFGSGQGMLSGPGRSALAPIAARLVEATQKLPADMPWAIHVEGHTDATPASGGRYGSNLALSAARAASVAQALVEAGIPADRISIAGHGEARPLVEEIDADARSTNRRVEVSLITQ